MEDRIRFGDGFRVISPLDSVSLELPSSEESRNADSHTIDREGIRSLDLMERASKAITWHLLNDFRSEIRVGRTIIFCGLGNNGGDGLAVARLLHARGAEVTCVCIEGKKRSKDNAANLERVRRENIEILLVEESNLVQLSSSISALGSKGTLLVDALLGSGQRGNLREPVASVAIAISEMQLSSGAPLVSIDALTGGDTDTGVIDSNALHPELIYAVQQIKRGQVQAPSLMHCGRFRIVDAGIQYPDSTEFDLVLPESISRYARRADGHKTAFARVSVVGGEKGMSGAATLSAKAAIQCGAGVVRLFSGSCEGRAHTSLAIMHTAIGEQSGRMPQAAPLELKEALSKSSVCVFGPGIRPSDSAKALLLDCIQDFSGTMILDAGALDLLRGVSIKADCILTPHPGEAARMLAVTTVDIQNDRYSAVRELSQEFGACVVLKGASPVIYHEGRGAVVPFAHRYLSTAGAGDVLTGMIAAQFSATSSLFDATVRGVLLHALAAERCSPSNRSAPLLADALTENFDDPFISHA